MGEVVRAMKLKTQEKNKDETNQDECHHYWIIEIPNGPKSRGICKYCGETKYFFNSISDFTVPKRKANPLKLPRIPKVELDKGSKS
jgi:hypothetical protein